MMGIFIFFNPFPHTTAIKEICYYLSVIIVTILILSKKIDFTFKTPLLLPFGLFISWAFLSIFFAIDKENSIHDFYSHLMRYVILYYILINFFNSEKRLIYLSWIIIISSSLFIVGGLFYYCFILEEIHQGSESSHKYRLVHWCYYSFCIYFSLKSSTQ